MDNIYRGETVRELVKKDFIIKKNKVKLNTYNVFINKKFTEGNNGILVIYAPWCESCVLSKNMWENFARLFKYKFKIYALNTYNFRGITLITGLLKNRGKLWITMGRKRKRILLNSL